MQIKKLLVLINGDEVDEETIRFTCKLVKQYKCQLYILYTIIIPLRLPVDTELIAETAEAEKILQKVVDKAEELSCHVQDMIVLKTRATGTAVVKIMEEYDIDLVIIGSRYTRHLGQFSLGTTVPYILKNAPGQVLVYQQHMS